MQHKPKKYTTFCETREQLRASIIRFRTKNSCNDNKKINDSTVERNEDNVGFVPKYLASVTDLTMLKVSMFYTTNNKF